MGPVTRWSALYPQGTTLPAMGTILQMDDHVTAGRGRYGWGGAEMAILGCFIAPKAIQKAAQASGERAIMMERPRGLIEALAPMPHPGVGANSVIGRKAQRVASAGRRQVAQDIAAVSDVPVERVEQALSELLADDGED
jgi:hypothetical protein